MLEYKQVQFIGYAISTRPVACNSGDGQSVSYRQYYLGDENDERDLKFRLKLLGEAMRLAQGACDRRPEVLKIFVAPEFFFRGAHGAYFGVEVEKNFVRSLQEILAAQAPDIDMALCGTDLFADGPADFNLPEIADRYSLGDEYLRIYEACREFRTALGKKTPGLREIMFRLDELESPMVRAESVAMDPLAVVFEEMMFNCARMAPVAVNNVCRVLLREGRWLRVQKQLKANVDFILNYKREPEGDNRGSYLQTFVAYPKIAPSDTELKADDLDPYSVFHWKSLKVGVEICLDHFRSRLSRRMNDLDLQILPSCGIEAEAHSIAAKPGGYVFNCDGDHTLPDAKNGLDAHTQLFRVEKDSGGKLGFSRRIDAEQAVSVVCAEAGRYFSAGAGEVHVYGAQDLAK
jgi:hypothetical protein